MAYIVHAFQTRKAGLTPAEFRDHYDQIHIPLLRELVGPDFPVEHRRHYLDHTTLHDGIQAMPIVFTGGDAATRFFNDFDVFAEMIFEDEAHFFRFATKLQDKATAKTMMEDQLKYQDPNKVWSAKFQAPSVSKREE